jgi:hypothetical protein
MNKDDKIHREIAIEGASEVDHLHHKESWYHHVGVKVLSISMAIMFVMWIFAGFPIGGIIRGQIESEKIDSGKLKLEEFTIEFSESALNELLSLYYLNEGMEISVCMQGELDSNIVFNDRYLIDSLYVPEIYEQSYSHVNFESCSLDTLIMLHTHPYKSCLASETDLSTLARNQEVNPDIVMLVMCEPERFSVYW